MMRDKVKIENVEMRVIKCENRKWLYVRERERVGGGGWEQQMIPIATMGWIVEESRVVDCQGELMAIVFLLVFLLKKNKTRACFCGMGWTSYKFEWLVVSIY